MDTLDNSFEEKKEKAKNLYNTQKEIRNPYFGQVINLNAEGFHHLQFSAKRERDKKEQSLKFNLLPLAFEVIRKAGTVQEYRTELAPIGKRSARGEISMKKIEYWGFDAIVGEKKIKIRTVVRRVGAGNIIFWSVMPIVKLRNGTNPKLFTAGIEDN